MLRPGLIAVLAFVASPALAHSHHHRHASAGNNVTVQAASCDNAKFLADQKRFASGELRDDVPETVCGTAGQVLRSKTTRSGLHGYFYLTLSGADGGSIEIVSDLDEMKAPAWPWVKTGDTVQVTGRYYYDSASRQGIDWTHHGSSRKWPFPGSVTVNGTVYQ
jgi:hypothetical protein